jgi:hypothetical protein
MADQACSINLEYILYLKQQLKIIFKFYTTGVNIMAPKI